MFSFINFIDPKIKDRGGGNVLNVSLTYSYVQY